MEGKIKSLREADLNGKRVLLRLDINSPIDPKTKRIVNTNRIEKSLPTLRYLMEHGARTAIIAHQGDTLDYQNLIPLSEHALKLSALLGCPVPYVDDVCGPSAIELARSLAEGGLCLLGNLRYLSEEISTFETVVKLKPSEMLDTWLVRSLAPHFDLYVNDAFAAAHRSSPSMVAFQEILPAYAGELLFQEYTTLTKVLQDPARPSLFVLGGAKISDAFGMMEEVLSNQTADKILTSGVTGVIMLMAQGYEVGSIYYDFLKNKNLLDFIEPARKYLKEYPGKIMFPRDLAIEENGQRKEIPVSVLPLENSSYLDIGSRTIKEYSDYIQTAGTIFVNGPAGVYENPLFDKGTRELWQAIADAPGYSVIGGGDTVSAAGKFIDLSKISYVCTGGGAMVQFMTGETLPLIAAMENAKQL